ncbi:MAG: aminopeptidase P N-terminal domain-containing protein [Candidatus Obscuribacterales bacterium]|nr:aminopeptidase P N-terminal domain-containing protein [Candidatus Obscuribacterales bacterium]
MQLLDRLQSSTLRHGPATPAAAYKTRLQRFWEQLKPNTIAILVSNPERTRSNDTEFTYRQSSDLVYLNGFPEPDSILVVSKLEGRQEVIMFVQPKDREKEIWTGIREGIEGAKARYFADKAYPIGEFEKEIGKLLNAADGVYYRFRNNHRIDARFRKLWEVAQKDLLNPDDILHEMRLFKSGDEVSLIRHASAISAEAHKQAMLACRPGLSENHLEAVLSFVFRACGALAPSYNSIVASGNNAVILHYTRNDDLLRDGDLVLIDAACEYGSNGGGYASDITRCFPVNGKFSEAQREIYQLVLDSQLAAIAACKPGAQLIDAHAAACKVLEAGLYRLNIIPGEEVVPFRHFGQPVKKPPVLRDFFMHGTSHWLGIDVHDVGRYDEKDGSNDRRASLKRRILKPGMVFTVEPGLYFDKDDKRVPEKYRGIGVRIEDDVLITDTGCEILTTDVPKTVAEIEALMDRC